MILALESACYTNASVALYDGTLADQRVLERPRDAAALLLPTAHALCAEHGCAAGDIAALAVDCGPGSFTGIRIAIATALGLRDGWGTPVVAVSQFDLHFVHLQWQEAGLVLLDARSRGLLYYAYRAHDTDETRGVVAPSSLPELYAGFPRIPDAVASDTEIDASLVNAAAVQRRTVVDALAVACEARRALTRGAARHELEPVYLHTSLQK